MFSLQIAVTYHLVSFYYRKKKKKQSENLKPVSSLALTALVHFLLLLYFCQDFLEQMPSYFDGPLLISQLAWVTNAHMPMKTNRHLCCDGCKASVFKLTSCLSKLRKIPSGGWFICKWPATMINTDPLPHTFLM